MLKNILISTRSPFVAATFANIVFTTVLAHLCSYGIPIPLFIAVATGVLFLHLGANTANDYYDWDNSDKFNRNASPFNGGSRNNPQNVFSRGTFLTFTVIFFVAAAVLGLFVMLKYHRNLIPIYGLGGLFLGFLYSGPRGGLQSRGLGELAIFAAFGPVLSAGIFYALTGTTGLTGFIAGIPGGAAVLNILLINEIPDEDADRLGGKNNFNVRFGHRKTLMFAVFNDLIAAAAAFLLFFFGILPIIPLVILSVIFIVHAVLIVRKFGDKTAIPNLQKLTITAQAIALLTASAAAVI
ncbi:prenyltransferase [Myxococcota bacterium]|nr:prenyltransferase [Myxococcota bacterium]MBU1380839.1 prenyltransferase [Myxococcota bacterium]MBU1499183.1 prenyltransferase [Myxococcota bacterium]